MSDGILTRTFRPPFFVPDSLDDLNGPATGTLEIPHSIMWSQQGEVIISLEEDWQIEMAYREILGTARPDDLLALVNKDHLMRLWPVTFDRLIVRAWEEKFPILTEPQ